MNPRRTAIVPVSLGFTALLIMLRMAYTHETYFLFLFWNLFLAGIPYLISLLLNSRRHFLVRVAGFAGWLVFFPNAPYIITDLFHLSESPPVPLWYDLIVLFSAAWNGILLGLLSLKRVELFLLERFRPLATNTIMSGCIFLGGFGVYAGRYLRWNSWEVVTHPRNIMSDIIPRLLYPQHHQSAWGMTIVLGSFLLIIYHTIRHSRI